MGTNEIKKIVTNPSLNMKPSPSLISLYNRDKKLYMFQMMNVPRFVDILHGI
jgi:hypothetical protein